MGKTFEFNGAKGSFLDQVLGVEYVHTDVVFARTEKGLAAVMGDDKYLHTLDITTNLTEDWSIRVDFKVGQNSDGASWESVLGIGSAWTTGIGFFQNRVIWYYTDASLNILNVNNVPEIGEWAQMIVTNDSATNVIQIYINGEVDGSWTHTKTLKDNLPGVYVGEVGSRFASGFRSMAQVYNHVLTADERAKLYQEFLRASPTSKIIR